MSVSNWLRLPLVVFLAVVVQVAVLDQIVVFNAHPDVLVMVPIAAALLEGPERGAILGFVVGLAADLFVNLPYGLSPLTFVLAAFAIGLFVSIPGANPGPVGKGAIVALGAGLTTVLYALIGAIAGQKGMLGRSVFDATLVVTLGALLMAPIVIAVMRYGLSGANRHNFGMSVPSGGSATT
jgi:rod shape-determining protein MreD